MEKTINKSKSLFLFVIMFLLAISMFGGGTVTANAQTVESNYTVQDIIDNTVFVTFRKGDTAERGKYIIACYYVPNEYYAVQR